MAESDLTPDDVFDRKDKGQSDDENDKPSLTKITAEQVSVPRLVATLLEMLTEQNIPIKAPEGTALDNPSNYLTNLIDGMRRDHRIPVDRQGSHRGRMTATDADKLLEVLVQECEDLTGKRARNLREFPLTREVINDAIGRINYRASPEHKADSVARLARVRGVGSNSKDTQ
ncbi:MAG: hypothetical protein M3P33_00435 [bacterium]|nr:hypothetical protein [bacterium]